MAELSGQIIQELLLVLRPFMWDKQQRRSYLFIALGTNATVFNHMVWDTPVDVFIPQMVNELILSGEIAPGKPAICALLEVIRENVGVDKQLEIDNLQQKIIKELTKKERSSSVQTDKHSRSKQMSFITELRTRLISDKQVYDLSRNEEFAEFNFIGLKETPLSVDLVAFTKADGFTEKQIVDLRDRFFNITQIVSYDFGLKPGPRMPNGLLGLVFEDECPRSLIEFIKKQTKISHWERSAVLVSWVIDVKYKQIHTHNNPVSLLPPVVIMEDSVFPGLEYLKSFIYTYRSPSIHLDNDTKASSQNFVRLESRLEEIYKIIKTMPEQQSKYNFPNAKRVQIFEQVDTYIENNNINEQDIKQSLEYLRQLIEKLQQQYPHASEEQAAAIIDAEFKEIQRTQPQRWQKIWSLKRLWNGVKKGSLKVGEHFAEETPWGKAIIGFLEGITDETE
ncbi:MULTISPECIES: hypothetical protein [Calothrix]|uniref:Effector-associated domain-containing protein n=2 Tax=Calothrix TaxID=1186 RepID=A0ABR8AGH7_9CYAN|nr:MULTISPECIES: hypothetical protein [Calothrix]MBD2198398.1 hypothetical protein [Calothrix parietina FACHB-288]MBD2226723.1 hypothetical protein [Calothrix anomala FACHB-343]